MVDMPITPNQVIALNLARARRMRRWTQAQASERIAPYLGERWSKATFSVAERSIDHPERIRQFTADDVVAFAAAFGLPVAFFFTPPADATFTIAAPDALKALSRDQLLALTSPDDVNPKVASVLQESVEEQSQEYRRELEAEFGVEFPPTTTTEES